MPPSHLIGGVDASGRLAWCRTMADEKKRPDQGAVGCVAIVLVAAAVLYVKCAGDKPADPVGRTPEKVAEDERKADEMSIAARMAAAAPPPQERPSGDVTAAEFGEQWPFTVTEGTLHCLAGAGRSVASSPLRTSATPSTATLGTWWTGKQFAT